MSAEAKIGPPWPSVPSRDRIRLNWDLSVPKCRVMLWQCNYARTLQSGHEPTEGRVNRQSSRPFDRADWLDRKPGNGIEARCIQRASALSVAKPAGSTQTKPGGPGWRTASDACITSQVPRDGLQTLLSSSVASRLRPSYANGLSFSHRPASGALSMTQTGCTLRPR